MYAVSYPLSRHTSRFQIDKFDDPRVMQRNRYSTFSRDSNTASF